MLTRYTRLALGLTAALTLGATGTILQAQTSRPSDAPSQGAGASQGTPGSQNQASQTQDRQNQTSQTQDRQTQGSPTQDRQAQGSQVQDRQTQGSQGLDARTGTATGAQAGRGAMAGHTHGQEMVILHGLAMAIEGSTLQALAMQQGGAGGPQGAGQLQQHARSAWSASDRLLQQGGQAFSGAGAGGQATGTSPGRSGTAGDAATASSAAPRSTTTGSQAGSDTATTGAQRGQAGVAGLSGGSASQRLYTAANAYASALRRQSDIGGQGEAGAQGAGGQAAGGQDAAGQAAGAAGRMGLADMQSVAVLNHGVKEVIDAYQIRHMARAMGSTGGHSSLEPLVAHSREMDREGRQTVLHFTSRHGAAGAPGGGAALGSQSPGSGSARPGAGSTGTAGDAQGTDRDPASGTPTATGSQAGQAQQGEPNQAQGGLNAADAASIGILAQYAQEIVRAIDELDTGAGASGSGAADRGATSGSGREAGATSGSTGSGSSGTTPGSPGAGSTNP